MAKWDDIYQTVESTAYKAIKKTGEIADTASVHIKLKTISAKLNLKYVELGKLTYKQIKTEKSLAAEISGIISGIDSLRADAKALREKLEKAKEELNGVTLESLVVAVRVARAIKKNDGKDIDLKDFPLLMHVDEILSENKAVNIPWESFTF